jgi:serine/threonine protein kinase
MVRVGIGHFRWRTILMDDFRGCQPVNREKLNHQAMPAYMSREQSRGQAHQVDGHSDVYSLGVNLYELLTGELPFRGTARMLLHQVLHDDPRRPRSLNDSIPRDLETVCLKALAKEPDRR